MQTHVLKEPTTQGLERIVDRRVGLLTGGSDKHYSLGLASALAEQGVIVDFIGSDTLDCPEVRRIPGLTFLNLRGDDRQDAALSRKVQRVVVYYLRLVRYAATGHPSILHILWNNRFEIVDRTLMMLYYRALGKWIALTAHNVNAAKRDATDNWLNRLTLRVQYRLCNHVFVHTVKMKEELVTDFGVPPSRITVIPYGINNAVPASGLTVEAARRRLGIALDEKVVLFFGHITPYKGLEYLVAAAARLARKGNPVRLVIAGRVDPQSTGYWDTIDRAIREKQIDTWVTRRIAFIADDELETYFMSADAVVLPYVHIYQSGVAFLSYSFGVPLIATDVGSLREDVVENVTGFLCRPRDPADLADAIERYFASDLFRGLAERRQQIREFAHDRHSWSTVGRLTALAYASDRAES